MFFELATMMGAAHKNGSESDTRTVGCLGVDRTSSSIHNGSRGRLVRGTLQCSCFLCDPDLVSVLLWCKFTCGKRAGLAAGIWDRKGNLLLSLCCYKLFSPNQAGDVLKKRRLG